MLQRMSLKVLSVSASVMLLGFALAGCEPGQPKAASAPPAPPQVTVAKPSKRLVADQDEFVGRFVAVDAIEVRARVSGYLDAIHFKDGQLVKKGDLLFSLDEPKDAESKVPRFLAKHRIDATSYVLDAPDSDAVTKAIDPEWSASLPATFVFRGGKRVLSIREPLPSVRALDSAMK